MTTSFDGYTVTEGGNAAKKTMICLDRTLQKKG